MNMAITRAVEDILTAIEDEDPSREGLLDTPMRVAKAYKELLAGYKQKPSDILSTTFEADYDQMVLVTDVEFWSLCEHHMLPFHGKATIAYIPNGRVVGLSKLARLLHCFSRRLQIQERLTQQIAQAIELHLKPKGVGVMLEATHTCMAMRGVKTPGNMITSCLLGLMRDDLAAREEFLKYAVTKT